MERAMTERRPDTPIRMVIAGAAGRMGRRLVALSREGALFQLAAALDCVTSETTNPASMAKVLSKFSRSIVVAHSLMVFEAHAPGIVTRLLRRGGMQLVFHYAELVTQQGLIHIPALDEAVAVINQAARESGLVISTA